MEAVGYSNEYLFAVEDDDKLFSVILRDVYTKKSNVVDEDSFNWTLDCHDDQNYLLRHVKYDEYLSMADFTRDSRGQPVYLRRFDFIDNSESLDSFLWQIEIV